jgi:hypothetical protein
MDTLVIPIGTIIHIHGMPVRLTEAAWAEGNRANFTTEQQTTPGVPGTWHRIVGPLLCAAFRAGWKANDDYRLAVAHNDGSVERLNPSPPKDC